MSCDTCPEVVVGTIAAEVQRTLDKVRRIKYLTTVFNRLFSELAGKIEDDLSALIDLIPTPPVLDISDIVAYYTCPLTPIALEIDTTVFQNMDPRLAAVRLRRVMQAETNAVIALYEEAVQSLRSYTVVRLIRKYVQEVYRTMEDAAAFVLEYPINLGRSILVRELCPDIYDSDARPFKALVEELQDWTFDGILPAGVNSEAESVIRILATGEARLLAWRTLGTIIV